MTLLHTLSDGLWHSGVLLGKTCHVSRTAIWKHIKQLNELGVSIISVPHQGYRLASPLIPLDHKAIRHELIRLGFQQPMDMHLFASLPSTNRFLKEQAPSDAVITLCAAETQTDGRGRFGRHWHSPFGENIYVSTRWRFHCDLSQLSGLGLVVSLAIHHTLEEWIGTNDIMIKWPNDLLWHERKLCGSLIEVIAESHGASDVVIGIGLNVNSMTETQSIPDKPWCSLYDITGKQHDRNPLLAKLIANLHQHVARFMIQGFSGFMAQWHPIDYLQHKTITITGPSGSLRGQAYGVNEAGQLILIDDDARTHYFSSGDTSLAY